MPMEPCYVLRKMKSTLGRANLFDQGAGGKEALSIAAKQADALLELGDT